MQKDIQTFIEQFENWVLFDIRLILKLSDEQGKSIPPDRNTYRDRHRPFVAAVILMCCAIDVLAAFRYGKIDKNVGDTFKNFIKDYFTSQNTSSKKSYDSKIIYEGLRSALVHGYSLNHDIGLKHEDPSLHLNVINNHPIIDVFCLYEDLEAVYFVYKQELLAGKHIKEFNDRWKYAKLVEYISDLNIKTATLDVLETPGIPCTGNK